MTLFKYEDLIRDTVADVSRQDKYWGWKLNDCGHHSMCIHWDYLDYIGQKSDFKITYHEVCSERWFSGDMGTDYIDDSPVVTVGDARWDDAKTIDDGIRMIIRQIARIAHSRY